MELFKILPNGKVEYDFNKFLKIDDVIIAEWEQNDPSLSRESLSKILERIWDKKSYCVNGKGKGKEKYWEQNIDRFVEYRKAKLEHICPCQILEKEIRNPNRTDSIVSQVITDTGYTVGCMNASIDAWTWKKINFSLSASGDDENYSDTIKYCPFCGRRLDNICIDS